MFHIVQPYTDRPDRVLTATIVRSFDTADEAFTELDRLREHLRRVDFRTDLIELVVVDEYRQRVQRHDEH